MITHTWDAIVSDIPTSFALAKRNEDCLLSITQTGAPGSVIIVNQEDVKVLLGDRDNESVLLLANVLFNDIRPNGSLLLTVSLKQKLNESDATVTIKQLISQIRSQL